MTLKISKRNTAIGILAIFVVLLLMIYSIYYPYPSGHSLDIAGFVMLWLRELIFLGVLLLVIIYAGASWLWRRLRTSGEKLHPNPSFKRDA
jgi:hypothetical protein